MSELDKSRQAQASDRTKVPTKSSLTEFIRVDSESRSLVLASVLGKGDGNPADESKTSAEGTPAATSITGQEGDPEADDGETSSIEPSVPKVRLATWKIRGGTDEASETKSATDRGQTVGLVLAALGVLLTAAPFASARVAEILHGAGDLRVHSGTLILGGLVLVAISRLRGALQDVRGSLEAIGNETARLEEIAVDGHAVRDTLSTVRVENSALTKDVTNLEAKIKRLTEVVTSPDYTVSIFRLAASVDQLGKHVEVCIKDQVAILQQRLAAIAQHADHADGQTASTLGQVQVLLKETHEAQRLVVQKGFDHLRAAAEQTAARIDQNLQAASRIEAGLEDQQELIASGLTGLSERTASGTSQIATGLEDLRGRIDRQGEEQAVALRSEFEEIDNRIDLAERNQASGIKQLTEHVKGQFASHVADLQQRLKSLADLAGRGREETSRELDDLGARLVEHAREQGASVQQTRDQSIEAVRASKAELAASLEQIGTRLSELETEQRAVSGKILQETQQIAGATKREVAASLEQIGTRLGELETEQRAASGKILQETQQVAGATKRELAASLEQIGTRLEGLESEQRAVSSKTLQETQQIAGATKRESAAQLEQLRAYFEQQVRGQLAALQEYSNHTQQAAGATKREIAANFEQVRGHLEKQARDHLAALQRHSQDAQQATSASKRELAASLEQIGTRIEKALEARSNALASDKLELAETFHSVLTEVRSCIAESIRHVAAPKADIDDALEPTLEPVIEATIEATIEPATERILEPTYEETFVTTPEATLEPALVIEVDPRPAEVERDLQPGASTTLEPLPGEDPSSEWLLPETGDGPSTPPEVREP